MPTGDGPYSNFGQPLVISPYVSTATVMNNVPSQDGFFDINMNANQWNQYFHEHIPNWDGKNVDFTINDQTGHVILKHQDQTYEYHENVSPTDTVPDIITDWENHPQNTDTGNTDNTPYTFEFESHVLNNVEDVAPDYNDNRDLENSSPEDNNYESDSHVLNNIEDVSNEILPDTSVTENPLDESVEYETNSSTETNMDDASTDYQTNSSTETNVEDSSSNTGAQDGNLETPTNQDDINKDPYSDTSLDPTVNTEDPDNNGGVTSGNIEESPTEGIFKSPLITDPNTAKQVTEQTETTPAEEGANKTPIPGPGSTPATVGTDIATLEQSAGDNPDSVINTIKGEINPSDAKLALADRLEKRKNLRDREQRKRTIKDNPLRMMSDEDLEMELRGFVLNNSMDPQIETIGSNKKKGDFFTLMQWGKRKDGFNYYDTIEDAHPIDNLEIDDPKNGMPLYFKDLRDGAYIFFRAYLDGGITDNFAGNWKGENYIGRSEQVWTYTHGTREINFKLKLVAQTPDELDALYEKLNRVTSLVYPEYKKFQEVTVGGETIKVGGVGAKERMKPPLTKLRLGELFGDINNELTGFIKNCNITFPAGAGWEIKRGKRVPKQIDLDISYQPIHSEVPSLSMAKISRGDKGIPNTFYGITRTILREKKDELGF